MTTPGQEKSPDTSQSQKTSRASSVSANAAVAANTVSGNGSGTGLTENNSSAAAVNSENNECSATPDSVTTVKNSLIISNNATSNNKKSGTLKKPKKQAGWLVDFNDTGSGNGGGNGGKNRMKSKPPSGSKNLQESTGKNNSNQKETETEVIKSCEVISNNTNENSSDFEDDPNSIQDEIVLNTPPFDEKSVEQQSVEQEPEIVINSEVESVDSSQINQINKSSSSEKNIERQEEDVCFNYASILKFIKHGKYFMRSKTPNYNQGASKEPKLLNDYQVTLLEVL